MSKALVAIAEGEHPDPPPHRLKAPPFRWTELSEKQFIALTWWRVAGDRFNGIIGDGSIRSGKTIAFSFSFVDWAMTSFDGELFGLAGKTIGALRQNVVEPLKRILKSRGGYIVKDSLQRNLLVIRRGDRMNTFELFGGKDEASASVIQGRTLAGMFFDEAQLMPESFVNQACARCSVKGSKFFFTTNPEHPRHPFKVHFIDQAKEKRFLYLHFTMADNLSLSPEIVRRYEALYVGTFRLRYVKGLWVAAEGAVYDMFDATENEFDGWEGKTLPVEDEFVAVDYGTANPCAFLHFTVRDGVYCIEREYYFSSRERGFQKTDSDYRRDLENFLGERMMAKRNTRIIVDPSASSFIVELERSKFIVEKAENDVLDGIRAVQRAMAERRVKISRSKCPRLLDELASYRWNQKASERGQDEPLKEHDHACDAMRYGIFGREQRFSKQVRAVPTF